MQVLESGVERLGLTLSIVNPLGRFGIAGNGVTVFLAISTLLFVPAAVGGDGILSPLFLFLMDCRVFGGEMFDTRYVPLFCRF